MNRFLSQHHHHGPHLHRTSAPSSGSSFSQSTRPSRSFPSSGSSGKGSVRRPSSAFGAHKQAMVAEADDEPAQEPEEDELVPDEEPDYLLEDILQSEAEVLAAELQELESEGIDPNLVNELETGVEAAESLVTMREARQRIAEVRKDRGYGKAGNPGKGAGKGPGGKTNRKAVTNCFDCGEPGHWQGDPQCKKPGQGLGRTPMAKKAAKQVRLTEALTTEVYPEEDKQGGNEVMVTHHLASPLPQILVKPNEALVTAPLAQDKMLMGVLDSACNRTCSGDVWVGHYMTHLEVAPDWVRHLILFESEDELFRFGNGGSQKSSQRVRVPIMVGNSLVLVWISVVKVPSLGLLLGRDFLDAIGAVLSFSRKMLRADKLDGYLIPLKQLMAGHFALSAALLKLAALLHIDVPEKATVEQIKQMCRPVVGAFMLKPGKSSTASSSTEVKPAQQQPERTEMTPKGAPKDDEVGSWSSSSATHGIIVQDVHALLAQQDIKYQGMLSQVMQHVMALSNTQQDSSQQGDSQMGLLEEELSRGMNQPLEAASGT